MPKTLPQKFFIKENYIVSIMNPPKDFLKIHFHPLPDGVTIKTEITNQALDVQIYFIKTRAEVEKVIPDAVKSMKPNTYIWLCYPKGGAKAKLPTDLNRDSFWEISSNFGLKPVHQISIDEVWSGLRFRIND